MVSLAVNAVVDGERLTQDDLIFETMLVLVGGDETTRHVISGGLAALLEHPAQFARLRANPQLVPSAVEEMLRWVTPIQNMNRTATRDTELGGQKIRAGDRMLLLYPSANRDEAIFRSPFEFDIERRPNDHVTFGGFGRHHCLGAQLARLELRVLDADRKRVHLFHEMHHQRTGALLATAEQLLLHVDTVAGRVVPLPDRLADRLAAIRAAHLGCLGRPGSAT